VWITGNGRRVHKNSSLSSKMMLRLGSHLVPNTSAPLSQLARARYCLEADTGIVCVLEPVESPIAASLQLLREAVALRAARNAAVLLAPALRGRTVLSGASVVDTDAASGNGEIEVVVAKIAACVRRLDDHLLATDRAGCERQPERRMSVLKTRGIWRRLTRSRHSTKWPRFRQQVSQQRSRTPGYRSHSMGSGWSTCTPIRRFHIRSWRPCRPTGCLTCRSL
jgi:hypothetical protein